MLVTYTVLRQQYPATFLKAVNWIPDISVHYTRATTLCLPISRNNPTDE